MDLPAQLELKPAWRQIRAELARAVDESTYEVWLAPLEATAWDGRVLLLQAPSATTRTWVAKRFGALLETCTRAVVGPAAQVAFQDEDDAPGTAGAPSTLDVTEHAALDLNPRYSFAQFIIGDGNRLAHAAALAVAEQPGQAYNPLFLYSPPGLGKTHLLHAIGNYVLAFGTGLTVRYTTVETFTNQFISALSSKGAVERFKHAYRDIDVLLLDDVQFLASKVKTEEEFFHTFNALYETGRQLVLTCDRLPVQLLNVEERLRERFGSGLVAEIRPPDLATRVAILRKRAVLDDVVLAEPGVLELIASRIATNIRTLEGALIQVVAYASLTRRPIDRKLATKVLDRIHPASDAVATISIESIQKTVADHFGLTREELVSASRAARIAWPRQIAIHISKTLTGASLPELGAAFGGRNHSTVLHALKRVAARTADDRDAANSVQELEALLRARQSDRSS